MELPAPALWRDLRLDYYNHRAQHGVDFEGQGEVLHISATPTGGKRTIEIDPDNGLIYGEDYAVMPSQYVIERYGWHPRWVALTFDDGPDGQWTPKILDILKAKHANATFFVIGENMQGRPDLVQREVSDGDIVGNHTWTHPNISMVSPAQSNLELNTTQRLFEVLTGRSMRLFRPPFFGDAEPTTADEINECVIAQRDRLLPRRPAGRSGGQQRGQQQMPA